MKPCVLALGFFDGVHLGHGGLLQKARRQADALGISAAALTFDRHPSSLIVGKATPLLNTAAERAGLMKRLYAMDEVCVLPFNEETRNLPWEQFAKNILLEEYGAKHLVCGHDYRFGKNGSGTPEKLEEFCKAQGIGFDCIPEIRLEGETVSSTLIRKLLSEGNVEKAARFLGHPHWLTGTVVDGRKVGRTLGVPTANLQTEGDILLPKQGVYAAKACFEGESYPAVVNIGTRPTFEGSGVTIEPWLLDFSGDLYGKELRLEFYAFLREERKFSSPQELKEEVCRNAETARKLLK